MPSETPVIDASCATSSWRMTAHAANWCSAPQPRKRPHRRALQGRDVAMPSVLAAFHQGRFLAPVLLKSRANVCNCVCNRGRYTRNKIYKSRGYHG
jgi:hypothetical protein